MTTGPVKNQARDSDDGIPHVKNETNPSGFVATNGPMAAAVIRETTATGPVASCRDEPNRAATIAGRKAA
jgi:hypothetical protein